MSRPALLLAVAVLLMGGCRFERRAGGEEEGTAAEARSAPSPVDAAGALPAEEALLAFQGYREAGAVEEARVLLHPDAELLSDGERYGAGAAESELRPLLAPGQDLGSWTISRIDTLAAGGGRLFVVGYDGPVAGDAGPPGGWVESILLVPASGGWRVRLLHRSSVP